MQQSKQAIKEMGFKLRKLGNVMTELQLKANFVETWKRGELKRWYWCFEEPKTLHWSGVGLRPDYLLIARDGIKVPIDRIAIEVKSCGNDYKKVLDTARQASTYNHSRLMSCNESGEKLEAFNSNVPKIVGHTWILTDAKYDRDTPMAIAAVATGIFGVSILERKHNDYRFRTSNTPSGFATVLKGIKDFDILNFVQRSHIYGNKNKHSKENAKCIIQNGELLQNSYFFNYKKF